MSGADHDPPRRPAGTLVLVAGRDPTVTFSGHSSYVRAQARAAVLAGYEPHIFAMAPRAAVLETDFGFVHRMRSPIRPPRQVLSMLQRPFIVPGICRFLERRPGSHILHGFGTWADTATHCRDKLRRRGVAVAAIATAYVTAEHEVAAKGASRVVEASPTLRLRHRTDLAWTRHVALRFERNAFRSADAIVVNYESVRTMLQEAYGPGLNIRRLAYAAPLAFRDPLAPVPLPRHLEQLGDPAAPLIVSVSRHDGRKGLDVLIAALAGLRDAGVPFRACLVGPGELLSAHRRLVVSRGLQTRVSIPGKVPDVLPYLANCDAFVLPSEEEGSGSVSVLEALQVGVPIVASAVDGIPEDLSHGRNALLVPAGDAPALARTLATLLADPPLKARLCAAARLTYQRRFAPPVLTQELAALYNEFGLRPAL
jgi:glycosyltransferase involved in cell wall biosynthesis